MKDEIQLGSLRVEVLRKAIKNVHLSVHPPMGRVTVSAPLEMNLETIRVYLISKLGWIRAQQKQLQGQERESPRAFVERESHYLWGRRYLMEVREAQTPPKVELGPKVIHLQVRPGSDGTTRRQVVESWYRSQLKLHISKLIDKWKPRLGVEVTHFGVRRMKTKWGSCTPHRSSILLNLELAKKPKVCLEYIVVHEMVHLLEPTHNERFQQLMDFYLPNWRMHRQKLNRLPVRHEEWSY